MTLIRRAASTGVAGFLSTSSLVLGIIDYSAKRGCHHGAWRQAASTTQGPAASPRPPLTVQLPPCSGDATSRDPAPLPFTHVTECYDEETTRQSLISLMAPMVSRHLSTKLPTSVELAVQQMWQRRTLTAQRHQQEESSLPSSYSVRLWYNANANEALATEIFQLRNQHKAGGTTTPWMFHGSYTRSPRAWHQIFTNKIFRVNELFHKGCFFTPHWDYALGFCHSGVDGALPTKTFLDTLIPAGVAATLPLEQQILENNNERLRLSHRAEVQSASVLLVAIPSIRSLSLCNPLANDEDSAALYDECQGDWKRLLMLPPKAQEKGCDPVPASTVLRSTELESPESDTVTPPAKGRGPLDQPAVGAKRYDGYLELAEDSVMVYCFGGKEAAVSPASDDDVVNCGSVATPQESGERRLTHFKRVDMSDIIRPLIAIEIVEVAPCSP